MIQFDFRFCVENFKIYIGDSKESETMLNEHAYDIEGGTQYTNGKLVNSSTNMASFSILYECAFM